jgi:hypothetical protein
LFPSEEDCVNIFAPLNDELDAPDVDSLLGRFNVEERESISSFDRAFVIPAPSWVRAPNWAK